MAGTIPLVAERTWKIATAAKKPILSAMTSDHATDSRLGRFGLARRKFARSYALFRFRLTNVRTGASNYWLKNQRKGEFLAWLLIWLPISVMTAIAHLYLRPYLQNKGFVEDLSGTALQLGSALLGATAIVASLVLFAMQVNVERLPHGLFRRLSADKRLLASFTFAFMASILIACLPLITPVEWSALAIFAAVLLTALVLRLFLYAYRRALTLINPIEQLRIVIGDVSAALERWGKQASWFSTALPPQENEAPPNPHIDSTLDTGRAAFMLQNNWGIRVTKQGLDHCISVNGRAASQGDHRVAEAALNALVRINATYLQAKGTTFFAENGFIEVPHATDPVINHSLEQLRRQFRAGLGRRDEEHVNMLLKAYGDLAQLYAGIDYGRPEADPWHASLATAYLKGDIKSIIPQNLPDSMMQGVRILGVCAIALLNRGKATSIVSIVDELGPIGAAMSIREEHRPVTLTAMQQLAGLTYHMINTGVFDPGYTFGQICDSVELTAQVVLGQPNPALTSVHRSALAPYFSPTTESSLGTGLRKLANALLEKAEFRPLGYSSGATSSVGTSGRMQASTQTS